MKYSKTLFSLFIVVILAVSISGCSESESGYTTTQTTKTSIATPTEWTAYDKDIYLDSEIYIPSFEIEKPTTFKMTLTVPNDKSLFYLGVIPESELERWKEDSTASEYQYLKTDVGSGTYTVTLPPGKYYIVIGYPTPETKTLKEDTVVVKAGDYVGIPIYLDNILYADNVGLMIDIREANDINILFIRADEYNILQQGGTPRVIAYHKKATSGTHELTNAKPSYWSELPPDTYYLVFDNTYSMLTDKTIDYKVEAKIVEPITIHLKIVVKEEG